jgi:hypothetical protein
VGNGEDKGAETSASSAPKEPEEPESSGTTALRHAPPCPLTCSARTSLPILSSCIRRTLGWKMKCCVKSMVEVRNPSWRQRQRGIRVEGDTIPPLPSMSSHRAQISNPWAHAESSTSGSAGRISTTSDLQPSTSHLPLTAHTSKRDPPTHPDEIFVPSLHR